MCMSFLYPVLDEISGKRTDAPQYLDTIHKNKYPSLQFFSSTSGKTRPKGRAGSCTIPLLKGLVSRKKYDGYLVY